MRQCVSYVSIASASRTCCTVKSCRMLFSCSQTLTYAAPCNNMHGCCFSNDNTADGHCYYQPGGQLSRWVGALRLAACLTAQPRTNISHCPTLMRHSVSQAFYGRGNAKFLLGKVKLAARDLTRWTYKIICTISLHLNAGHTCSQLSLTSCSARSSTAGGRTALAAGALVRRRYCFSRAALVPYTSAPPLRRASTSVSCDLTSFSAAYRLLAGNAIVLVA